MTRRRFAQRRWDIERVRQACEMLGLGQRRAMISLPGRSSADM